MTIQVKSYSMVPAHFAGNSTNGSIYVGEELSDTYMKICTSLLLLQKKKLAPPTPSPPRPVPMTFVHGYMHSRKENAENFPVFSGSGDIIHETFGASF